MKIELVSAANDIRAEKYAGSDIVFLAGSLVRGERTATSDLDLVVVFGGLTQAYRESFRFKKWPVEAFVHDPETLKYFFLERDKTSGVPSLAAMVSEGLEIPKPTDFSRSLKRLADSVLADGPPSWSQDDVDRSRYMITSLVDDLKEPRSRAECTASGVRLYEASADHYFRSRGLWSARDKAIPRKLNEADPELSERFVSSFSALFESGDTEPVIGLVEGILERDGGWLFEGYKSEAPVQWRSN